MPENIYNKYKFFEHRECEYYPCHNLEELTDKKLNCLFCYCPLYRNDPCPGTFTIISPKGKQIKDCSACTFIHDLNNYELIMAAIVQYKN